MHAHQIERPRDKRVFVPGLTGGADVMIGARIQLYTRRN